MKISRLLSGSATSWLCRRGEKEERKETKMHFVFIAVNVYFPPCMKQRESFFFLCCVPFVGFTSNFFFSLLLYNSPPLLPPLPGCFDFHPTNYIGIHEVISEAVAALMSSKWEQGSGAQRVAEPAALKP